MPRPSSSPLLSEKEAYQKLQRLGQQHLLKTWPSLSRAEQDRLLFQISHLSEPLFQLQKEHLFVEKEKKTVFERFDRFSLSGSQENKNLGKKMIAEGKCACLIVAGGQGSRLKFERPKGCFPVSLFKRKSLFQLAAEKIKAAGKQVGRLLECSFMTSPLNHFETEVFFDQHAFFGLSPSQVHFFYQDMWPLLDFEGNLFLESSASIAVGPNGNGGALHRLSETGILNRWKDKGIEMINFVLIDNPLADPFDAELFGFHATQENDISLKAMMRQNVEEKVGVLVKNEGKIRIVEYSELSKEEKAASSEQGFYHPLANLSLFCFSISFIEKISKNVLPFHAAQKAVKCLDQNGSVIVPEKPNAWKFEEFIFDTLAFTDKIEALVYPREECFAPLKNFRGADSIESVQAALQASDRKIYFHVSGIEPPPSAVFELSQDFYYPTEALMEKWKGKSLPKQSYIEG